MDLKEQIIFMLDERIDWYNQKIMTTKKVKKEWTHTKVELEIIRSNIVNMEVE